MVTMLLYYRRHFDIHFIERRKFLYFDTKLFAFFLCLITIRQNWCRTEAKSPPSTV